MLSFLKTNIKIVFFLSWVWLALPGIAIGSQPVVYKGVVTSFKLNIRKSPSRKADVLVVMDRGQKIDVIKKQAGIGSWLTVRYKGNVGYVRNRPQYIRLVPVTPAPKTKKPVKIKKASPSKKEKQQHIEDRIQTQEKMVETFTQKEVEIIEGLNETDYALNKARLKLSALSAEISQLEASIAGLNIDRELLFEEISENREYAGKRLRALYKMNMIGRLDVAGLPSSVFDFFLQQNSMKRVIQSDFQVLDKQTRDLERFEILEKELQKEIQAKTDLEIQVTDQVRINQKESLKKEMILRQIRKKKKLSLAAVEALKQAALQLDNRISTMQKGGTTQIIEGSFPSYKGRLNIPVKGEVISKFGPSTTGDYKSYTFQKGIDIKVERGEPVKSVFKGEVMFAQWLKGYGNLLIINHGDNYYTLYAHVEEIFKKKGENVDTGEVIATAGDTGSIKGMCLHFELRHHGKPVNPMKWLKKGA